MESRLAKVGPGRGLPPAVLVGLGRGTLAAVRSLGRRGVDVTVAAPTVEPPAASRWTRRSFRLPDPLEGSEPAVAALLGIGRRLGGDAVLLPTDDVAVSLLTERREPLGELFRLAAPPRRAARLVLDKALQYGILAEAGLPLPRTWFPDREPLEEVLAGARFPLLVKPRSSEGFFLRHGRKLLEARTPLELRALLEDTSEPVLLQERMEYEVEDGYQFCSFIDRNGDMLGSVTLRKRDVFPRPYGNTIAVETADNPEVEAIAREALRILGFRGPSEVEVIRDRLHGRWGYIELNPRFTNHTAAQMAAGLDAPWLAYAEAAGLPPGPVRTTARRVVWTCPELRIPYSRALRPPRPLADSRGGRSLHVTDLFVPSDPLPLLRKARNALVPRAGRLARIALPELGGRLSTFVQLSPRSRVRRTLLRAATLPPQLPHPTTVIEGSGPEGALTIRVRGRAKFLRPLLARLGVPDPRASSGAAGTSARTAVMPAPAGDHARDARPDVEVAWAHAWLAPAFRKRGWRLIPSHVRMAAPIERLDSVLAAPSRSLASDLQRVAELDPVLESGEAADDAERFRREYYLPHVSARLAGERPLPLAMLARRGTHLFLRSGDARVAAALVIARGEHELWMPRLAPLNGSEALLRMGAGAAIYARLPAWAAARGFRTIDIGHATPFEDDGVLRYKRKWGYEPRSTPLGGYFAVRESSERGRSALAGLEWIEWFGGGEGP